MKAIFQDRYGSPEVALSLRDIEKPTPDDDEVLVQVHAACVNFANPALVRGKPRMLRLRYGLLKPNFGIPGSDIAGRVEAVGKNVTQFQPGDDVYGDLVDSGFGAYAEYVSAPGKALAPKPGNISFEEAAAVPQAALVALQGLRDKGRIQTGQRVLICGASSGNGIFAVQIAKAFGAEVTGVCGTRNLEMVRSLGADYVIDYTQEDFTKNGLFYDLILATVGYRHIREYEGSLSPKGTYVMAGGTMMQILQASLLGPSRTKAGGKTLTSISHHTSQDDLIVMKALIEAEKVKPLIDRSYPLDKTADALKYYELGHSNGKVVITIVK